MNLELWFSSTVFVANKNLQTYNYRIMVFKHLFQCLRYMAKEDKTRVSYNFKKHKLLSVKLKMALYALRNGSYSLVQPDFEYWLEIGSILIHYLLYRWSSWFLFSLWHHWSLQVCSLVGMLMDVVRMTSQDRLLKGNSFLLTFWINTQKHFSNNSMSLK